MKNSATLKYQQWLNHPKMPANFKSQLKALKPEQIDDAFFKDIEFGTAGMRGMMGLGTNRINEFTIKKVTIAYGLMLRNLYPQSLQRGVVIAHDNRRNATAYTTLTSQILNEMGIHTYVFSELVPTPLLSFAVRHLNCLGGIMLTASHNPKEYNGYKVYDDNGCQLVPNKIDALIQILSTLPEPLEMIIPSYQPKGLIKNVPEEVESTYVNLIKSLQLQPNLSKREFKIVFSPQHGASYRILPSLFRSLGYDVFVVPEQSQPDPDFSGTLSPNPEEKIAYEKAIEYAQKFKAPLVMVADPDADRVGLAYRDINGEYQLLDGNQSAALLIEYILSQRLKLQKLPSNGVIYDTIVTSPLGRKIAHHYKIKTETFLTGFKFIGDRIDFYQHHAGPQFIFGYEESYGCLIGDFVRDKDAIQALMLYAEMTLHHQFNGIDLGQALDRLYQNYGYHIDKQFSLSLTGVEGENFLNQLMNRIRQTPFKPFQQFKVVLFEDYQSQVSKDDKGHLSTIALPKANVIKLNFNDGSSIVVRPSGTEPKCKFYFLINGKNSLEVQGKLNQYLTTFTTLYLSEDKRLK